MKEKACRGQKLMRNIAMKTLAGDLDKYMLHQMQHVYEGLYEFR